MKPLLYFGIALFAFIVICATVVDLYGPLGIIPVLIGAFIAEWRFHNDSVKR